MKIKLLLATIALTASAVASAGQPQKWSYDPAIPDTMFISHTNTDAYEAYLNITCNADVFKIWVDGSGVVGKGYEISGVEFTNTEGGSGTWEAYTGFFLNQGYGEDQLNLEVKYNDIIFAKLWQSYYDLDDGEVTVKLKYPSGNEALSPTFLLRNLGLVKLKLKGCAAFDEQMVVVQQMLAALAYHKANPEPELTIEPAPAPAPAPTNSPRWYELRTFANECVVDVARFRYYVDWLNDNEDRGRYDFSDREELKQKMNRLERMPFMTREMTDTFNSYVNEYNRLLRGDRAALDTWNEQVDKQNDAKHTMMTGKCRTLGRHQKGGEYPKICYVFDGDPVWGSPKIDDYDEITADTVCGAISRAGE